MIQIGPFILDKVFARGAMGEIWFGHHGTGTEVAVKVLRTHQGDLADSIARFEQEVGAAALLDHPGIVVPLDYGRVDGRAELASEGRLVAGNPYYVMPRAVSCLSDSPPRWWPGMRTALLDILGALAHAHARDLVHRDIKPHNVLVFDEAPHHRVADFGIAWLHSDLKRATRSGSAAYMPPEQVRGDWRDFGPWTDLYAVGCMAWKILTGSLLFSGGRTAVLRAQLDQEPGAFEPIIEVPPGVEGWLRRLLSKDPGDRPPSAADAARDLSRMGLPSPAPGPRLPRQWRKARAVSEALPGAGTGLVTLRRLPVIARDREMTALWESLGTAVEGPGVRLCMLRGATGTGKTHLARWLTEQALECGVCVVTMTAVHSASGGTGDGMAPMLARLFRTTGMTWEERVPRVLAFLRRHGTQNLTLAANLSAAADPGEAPRALQAERHAAVVELIRLLGKDRPVLLRFEDAQWGAEARAFTQRLLAASAREPLRAVVVLTVRDDVVAPDAATAIQRLAHLPQTTEIPVSSLEPSASHTLIRQMLDLDEELIQTIHRRSDGVPLFAVQLIGHLVDRGMLVPGPRGLSLRSGARVDLPDDLHHLWIQRLDDALDGRSRSAVVALEIAAVLGHDVDVAEWHRATRAAGAAPDDGLIAHLQSRHLAYRPSLERFAFVHGLLAESLRRIASESGRLQDHHRACAKALASSKAPQASERRGNHFVEANDPEQALDPLLDAADERARQDDTADGVALAERIEALMLEVDPPDSDPRWGRLWRRQAWLERRRGRRGVVRDLLERLRDAAQTHGWAEYLAEAHLGLAIEARHAHSHDEFEVHAARAVDIAQELGLERLQAEVHIEQAIFAMVLGDPAAALPHIDAALEAASELQYGALEIDAHRRLAQATALTGDFDRALDALEQGDAIARRIGHRSGLAAIAHARAELLRRHGGAHEALEHYEEAIRIWLPLRTHAAHIAMVNRGLAELAIGDVPAAVASIQRGCDGLDPNLPLAAATHLLLHGAQAIAGDWTGWTIEGPALWATVRRSGLVEPDLIAIAKHVGSLAQAQGRPDAAAMAHAIEDS